MLFGEQRFESEGDRTNAWDGATDDAIALLSVVLKMIPQVDSSRVYCFGKSRGATVALLAGQRDDRIKRVLAWSAPSDWFAHMTYGGWSMQEIVKDTLLNRWGPGEGGEAGQFVEWFVKPSIEGGRSLSEARQHILASSPLYFVDLLKKTQIHHGIEDNMVPVENARILMTRIALNPNAEFEAFLHRDAGHDVEYQPDEWVTFSKSRAFLME
jgi:dipeptidyl aminopeptidase/acylaminoacyl peptidase